MALHTLTFRLEERYAHENVSTYSSNTHTHAHTHHRYWQSYIKSVYSFSESCTHTKATK